jgi:hypothetical protein
MDFRDPSTIPLPTTDDEFERLCLLITRDKYGAEYYRYGRNGQKQFGIDIYSAYHNGRYLQCKLYKKNGVDAILIMQLKKDVKQAIQKFPNLKQFIYAVSINTNTTLQDACNELSNDTVKVIPWFWNQLQEDIAQSKWLLRYYLNSVPGAQWISEDFIQKELMKGDIEKWQPLNFYSSISFVQWYGTIKRWDAPREHYSSICQAINNSFTNRYGDLPTAALVCGDGGSGKSVLLRRLAVDLRNDYTVYWIADNAKDFLENEWIYDIENNPNENYLLVLEDWYRNYSKTDDRISANTLLQKVRNKPNVRLLIGDRANTNASYPKSKNIVYTLLPSENATLFSYIINFIPNWKNKFSEEQRNQLFNSGLFQSLFVYQYADASTVSDKATNFFLEIIQSDYNQLSRNSIHFYKGLAQAIYLYANIYADYSVVLSPEAIIILAEKYSGDKRPFELNQNTESLINDSVVGRYFDIIIKKRRDIKFPKLRFAHDILADEGWRNIDVDSRIKFRLKFFYEILTHLKNENTNEDLASLLYRVLSLKEHSLKQDIILELCDFLIKSKCSSSYFTEILFSNKFMKIDTGIKLDYLNSLIGIGNSENGMWIPIANWMKQSLKPTNQLSIFKKLIDTGNNCKEILSNYYLLQVSIDPKKISDTRFLFDLLNNRNLTHLVTEIFKKIPIVIVKEAALMYLKLREPYLITSNFNYCLKLLKDEEIAKIRAIEYINLENSCKYQAFNICLNILKDTTFAKEKAKEFLQIPDAYKVENNFNACLQLIKDDPIAKEKAKEFLQMPDAYKVGNNFNTCLQLIKDDPIAKEKAKEFLKIPNAEKMISVYSTCINVLGEDASDIAEEILSSPMGKRNQRIVYRALQIAANVPSLDNHAKNIFIQVNRNYDVDKKMEYHFYLQVMKVPLFRLIDWQNEVNKLLMNYKTMHRNLFYSLTISHIDNPEPLSEACLYYARNWKNEFSRPKKHWGYLIRSLAHPVIQEKTELKDKIVTMCKEMLLTDNCPNDIKEWLNSISTIRTFPEWKRYEEDN